MSGISIVIIVFGILIIVTRAPLMWAPEKTRNFILSLFDTDQKMRTLGIIFMAFGVAFAWVGWDVPTTLGAIVKYFGLLIALGSGLITLFPAKMRPLADRVWAAFSVPALRVIGGLSTIFGLLLVWYGFSL